MMDYINRSYGSSANPVNVTYTYGPELRPPSKLIGDAIILERAARVIRERSGRLMALVIARVLERQAAGLRARAQ